MDWRPVAGLTSEDAGSRVERIIARVLLGAAVEAHNQDVARANKK